MKITRYQLISSMGNALPLEPAPPMCTLFHLSMLISRKPEKCDGLFVVDPRNASLTTPSLHLFAPFMSHALMASKDTIGGIQCLFSDIDGKPAGGLLLSSSHPLESLSFIPCAVNFLFFTPRLSINRFLLIFVPRVYFIQNCI